MASATPKTHDHGQSNNADHSAGLRYAFNTNGCAHHTLEAATRFMADCGYSGIALTVDHQHLDPLARGWRERATEFARLLHELSFDSVIETGARFLMDPRNKHQPTLLHPTHCGRKRRLHFLKRCVDIAAILGSETVSFWSGVKPENVSDDDALTWLQDGIKALLEYAQSKNQSVSLEPEPGHLISTVADFHGLVLDGLNLALDIGHLWVTGETESLSKTIVENANQLGTVALEDMKKGIHEHLFFGEGDLDVAAAVAGLTQIRWRGLVTIELSRDSHRAHQTIPGAIQFLRELESKLA